ncbi:MAG: hypothetical protein ACRCSP_07625 [Rhodoglobus sp.]
MSTIIFSFLRALGTFGLASSALLCCSQISPTAAAAQSLPTSAASSGAASSAAINGIGTYDNASTAIRYTGSWRTMVSQSDINSSSHYLNSRGKVEFTFTGDAIEWYSRLSPSSGIGDVFIDGRKVATVDRYAPSNSFATKVFEKRGLGFRQHTISLVWTGKRNPASTGGNLLIDAFKVVDTSLLPAPSTVSGTPFKSGLALSWSPVAHSTTAGYRVYRAERTGTDFIHIGSTNASTTTLHDVGLAASSSWKYRVTTINTAGNESLPSAVSTISTGPNEPENPFRFTKCPAATENVSTAAELQSALGRATPGTVIRLAPGVYSGQFTMTKSGTTDAPIWVCGPRTAIIDGGAITEGHGFFVNTVNDAVFTGFTIQNALKGFTVKSSTRVTVSDLLVQDIGYEGIHLRQFTTNSSVIANTITRTGLVEKKFGEGIYIGSSESNWCALTNCQADRVDGTRVMQNVISATGAQSIEAKEGTSDGVIRGNTVDDSRSVSVEPSWILVKGNGWVVSDNIGTGGQADGFSTNASVEGWGMKNVFVRNTANLTSSGFGLWIHQPASREPLENIVGCDNHAPQTGSGLTNVTCQP